MWFSEHWVCAPDSPLHLQPWVPTQRTGKPRALPLSGRPWEEAGWGIWGAHTTPVGPDPLKRCTALPAHLYSLQVEMSKSGGEVLFLAWDFQRAISRDTTEISRPAKQMMAAPATWSRWLVGKGCACVL